METPISSANPANDKLTIRNMIIPPRQAKLVKEHPVRPCKIGHLDFSHSDRTNVRVGSKYENLGCAGKSIVSCRALSWVAVGSTRPPPATELASEQPVDADGVGGDRRECDQRAPEQEGKRRFGSCSIGDRNAVGDQVRPEHHREREKGGQEEQKRHREGPTIAARASAHENPDHRKQTDGWKDKTPATADQRAGNLLAIDQGRIKCHG